MVSGRNESLREGLKVLHGLKAGGAVELLARSTTSGVPSESRLFLVALRGVCDGLCCPSSRMVTPTFA